MNGRLLDLAGISPAHVGAWRDLAARAAVPNPFFEPEAVLAAHANLNPRGVALLVIEGPDGWSACLPVRRLRLGGVDVALRSWSHLYAFLGMPLVGREQPVEALGALLKAAVHRQSAHAVALSGLPADGPGGAMVHRALASSGLVTLWSQAHERAVLRRRTGDDYLDHLGRHHQRESNRLARRLEETLGHRLTVVDRAGDAAAAETFLRLEASGWKGRAGTAMLSVPGHAAMFRELCERLRTQDRLQLLSLEAGSHVVSMKCNLAAGAALFCFKIAQDDTLSRFSPGVRLERLNVAIFHEQRHEQCMDSCAAADNAMINRLWPERRRVRSVVIGRRSARAGLAARGIRPALRLRSRLHARHSATDHDRRPSSPSS